MSTASDWEMVQGYLEGDCDCEAHAGALAALQRLRAEEARLRALLGRVQKHEDKQYATSMSDAFYAEIRAAAEGR